MQYNDDEKAADSGTDEILEEGLKRFELCIEAESTPRAAALKDAEFLSGDQWDGDVRRAREEQGRPCFTVNRMIHSVGQITNEIRQNRPSIKVSPVDDKADVETAKIRQGLIRNIEYNSNADVAYDTAAEGAAGPGFGFFRIISQYADPMSFDQELVIKAIPNPFKVHLDPYSIEPDGSDAEYGFVETDYSKEEYKSRFPDSEMAALDADWDAIGAQRPGWAEKGSARVVEYFYREYEEIHLVQLSNGESGDKAKLPEALPEGITIVSERKSKRPYICWVTMNAVEVLDKTRIEIPWVPLIPVYGRIVDINGKRYSEGIIRHARDPQKILNHMISAEVEAIALAPKAPFIAAEGQLEGYEHEWESANQKNYAVLQYKPLALNGQPMPAPQRQTFEPAVQAITQSRMQASEDIKATTGIYDAALGAQSNEKSGVAIQRRTQQGQTSNFHIVDNLTRSIRHGGRILNAWIPSVYDAARTERIVGDEGDHETVPLNQPFVKNGETVHYDLSVGKYDVAVETGPNYATRRQEAVAAMLDFTRAMPQQAVVIADLLVKNMDWPGAQEIAERLKAQAMRQGLVTPDEQNQQPLPPQAQQQMQQMGQQIQMLTEHLNAASQALETKQLELNSRERIEEMKVKAQIEIALAQLSAKSGQTLLEHEVSEISQRQDLLNQQAQAMQAQLAPQQVQNGAMPPDQGQPLTQPQQQPTGGSSPGQNPGVNP